MEGLKKLFGYFLLMVFLQLTSGCASRGDVVLHGFAFNFPVDSPDAVLLDYRYGDSKNPAARNAPALRDRGKSDQQSTTSGDMLRGDDLYVKWRLKDTGEVFEDTVDLKARLPKNIEECRIYFLVRGPQLHVYLITPQLRAKDEPRNGPAGWSYRHVLTIYPDVVK